MFLDLLLLILLLIQSQLGHNATAYGQLALPEAPPVAPVSAERSHRNNWRECAGEYCCADNLDWEPASVEPERGTRGTSSGSGTWNCSPEEYSSCADQEQLEQSSRPSVAPFPGRLHGPVQRFIERTALVLALCHSFFPFK